jgi:hypothetical protein
MSSSFDDPNHPLHTEYGPQEKKVLKVMIPLHKVWGFFKNRKKKKKTVASKENKNG